MTLWSVVLNDEAGRRRRKAQDLNTFQDETERETERKEREGGRYLLVLG